MIIEKINPVALDVVVYKIQKVLHDAFDVAWSIDTPKVGGIICYPRCYVNFKKSKKIIEYFDSAADVAYNIDYSDILDSEKNRVIILGDDNDIERLNANFRSTVLDIIILVDLSTTHPTVKHRADEEVRREVLKELEKIPNTTVVKVVRRLNKIFGDIQYDPKINLQPSHCFKVVLSIDRFSEDEKKC